MLTFGSTFKNIYVTSYTGKTTVFRKHSSNRNLPYFTSFHMGGGKCKILGPGVLMNFSCGTFLQSRNIGVLNVYILPISKNIGGAIAPPVPPVPPVPQPLCNTIEKVYKMAKSSYFYCTIFHKFFFMICNFFWSGLLMLVTSSKILK